MYFKYFLRVFHWLKLAEIAIFFEPFLAFLIFWHDALDDLPKSIRVVHLVQMSQFVNDDIVNHWIRCEKESGTQVYIAIRRARAPVGMIVFQADSFDFFFEILGIYLSDFLSNIG